MARLMRPLLHPRSKTIRTIQICTLVAVVWADPAGAQSLPSTPKRESPDAYPPALPRREGPALPEMSFRQVRLQNQRSLDGGSCGVSPVF